MTRDFVPSTAGKMCQICCAKVGYKNAKLFAALIQVETDGQGPYLDAKKAETEIMWCRVSNILQTMLRYEMNKAGRARTR